MCSRQPLPWVCPHVYQYLLVCDFLVCVCIGVKVHSRSVCMCARALRLLLDTACWGPGGHAVASPSPPPLPPLAGGWPWQGLTESWPGGGSTELHASPLSQPTEPTHSVCAGVLTPGQTHCTHTYTHACTATRPGEAPWASRCPNAPFLCFTFLLDYSWSLFLSLFFIHFLSPFHCHYLFLASAVLPALSLLTAMTHSGNSKTIETWLNHT